MLFADVRDNIHTYRYTSKNIGMFYFGFIKVSKTFFYNEKKKKQHNSFANVHLFLFNFLYKTLNKHKVSYHFSLFFP